MKRIAWMGLLAVVVSSNTGCCLFDRLFTCKHSAPACGDGCESACADGSCGGGHGGGLLGHHGRHGGGGGHGMHGGSHGMSGTVAYPYYTTRGPRDFFACNPGFPSN